MMRRPLIASLLLLSCAAPSMAETWVKVKSPHFTVISNGSEKQARQAAVGFEQIRTVVTTTFPGMRTDASAETVILAVKDEHTFGELMPSEKKYVSHLGGLFSEGWEKDYVVVRLDIPDENRNIVYHEYTHKVLHLNFTRLPVWLDEGLAEFIGNTWMRPDGIFIGAPSPRLAELRSGAIYPIETILNVNHTSPYYRDADKAGLFYAESWGLTHFLMLGPGMEQGQKMNAYLSSLQKGVDTKKSFDDTFGDRKDVERSFQAYANRFLYAALRADKIQKIDPSSFAGGPMTAAETDAMLAGFYTKQREFDLADKKLAAALGADPKSGVAHENQGFLDFVQGKDEDAQKEFETALALNPESYLAVYYDAMMKYQGKKDPDSLAQLDAAMTKALELNPRFAPALIVRSQIYVRQGKLQEAYNISIQAQKLEPDRGGYRTNSAAILLLGHNYPAAVALGKAVATRWYDSDSAEALAVVTEARRLGKIEQTPDEKAEEDREMEYAKDTTPVEGIIQSVHCEKSQPLEIVLLSGDKSSTFHSGKKFGVGFSDTLWYGEDHFSGCFHIDGMKALVRYAPSTDPNGEREMRWFEIRDELIPTSVSSGQN
jgi:tetratricopeptide (TPR) repeat protein